MAPLKLLLTGATGYVGGSVLSTLLQSSNPYIKQISITVTARKQHQIDTLKSHGVDTVEVKDLGDVDHLRWLARKHNLVIHTASGFHVGSAKALVEGLGDRYKETGEDVYFIHTSGTWSFAQPSQHDEPTVRELSDKDNLLEYAQNLESRACSLQRTTLLQVVSSAEALGVRSYILIPPDVYGRGTGLFTQHTMQLFQLVKSSRADGRGGYINDGSGGAGHVHIADLASLYELLLANILAGKNVPSGRAGLYFTETGYHNWLHVAQRIGEAGVHLNALTGANPESLTLEAAAAKWTDGDIELATNSFCLRNITEARLAFELGWKPQKTEADWWKWIDDVWKIVLQDK